MQNIIIPQGTTLKVFCQVHFMEIYENTEVQNALEFGMQNKCQGCLR